MVCNEFDMAEIDKLKLSRIEAWGVHFMSESSVLIFCNG